MISFHRRASGRWVMVALALAVAGSAKPSLTHVCSTGCIRKPPAAARIWLWVSCCQLCFEGPRRLFLESPGRRSCVEAP